MMNNKNIRMDDSSPGFTQNPPAHKVVV